VIGDWLPAYRFPLHTPVGDLPQPQAQPALSLYCPLRP
jgi:hypothetical protein